MNVRTLASVENGASNFKLRMQANKHNGMNNAIMYIESEVPLKNVKSSKNTWIFCATNTMYTQQMPNW